MNGAQLNNDHCDMGSLQFNFLILSIAASCPGGLCYCNTWLFSKIQGAERWSFLAFSSSVGCTSLSLNLNQHCQHCFRKRSQLARSLRIWSLKLRRILSSRLPSLTDCAISQVFVSAASFYCNAQAASCAKNLPRLAALRAGLRTRMLRLATRVLED